MATAVFKSARNLFTELETEATSDDEESFSNDEEEEFLGPHGAPFMC